MIRPQPQPRTPLDLEGRAWRLQNVPHALETFRALSRIIYPLAKDFYAAAGIDRVVFPRWLSGRTMPSAYFLWKLADALDCDIVLVKRKKPGPPTP